MHIIVNNKQFKFSDLKELIAYLMEIPLAHAKHGSIDAFKENISTASILVSELCAIQHAELSGLPVPQDTETKKKRTAQKVMFSRTITRMNQLAIFCNRAKDKNKVYTLIYDFILSLEGKALLSGFQLTHKVHKDTPRGNAEHHSILRPQ